MPSETDECVPTTVDSNCATPLSDCGTPIPLCQPRVVVGDASPSKPRKPLRVLFVQTDMRIGGAEMVTANVIRRLDRRRFSPELCCLKEAGPLGESLAVEIPVHYGLLRNKFDVRVWPRLRRLLRTREIDAVVTVGAGDKMFWGRLAARRQGVPVVVSALHSTGWPNSIGWLNRLLTPITDSFIAVADSHGRYLVEREHFPESKVVVIPNGVDTQRFAPTADVAAVRGELGIDLSAPVVGLVAALRPEKNHELFLEMAGRVLEKSPAARFLLVGDGPCRGRLVHKAEELGIAASVAFLGSRDDVPRLLAAMDVFALTSHIEANPVSILEAMSAGVPVVATNVGSIHDAVADGMTGFLVEPGDAEGLAKNVLELLNNPQRRQAMGEAARGAVVGRWSIETMVRGYEQLIESIYAEKSSGGREGLAVR